MNPYPARAFGRLLTLAVALCFTMPAAAQKGAVSEWRSLHGENGGTRYAPHDQINKDNFKNLRIAWRWKGDNFGTAPEIRNEVTPLFVDGTLYVSAGDKRTVVAIDPGTGETKWIWKNDDGDRGVKAARKNNRAVAYWTDGANDKRIVVITPGMRLVELNARTGQQIMTFGTSGSVDLFVGLRQRDNIDPLGKFGNSSPALVSNNVIVVGPALQNGYRPVTKENIPGWVRAYDVHTGKLLWTFHTIPEPGDEGYDTWENESARYTGNAGVWSVMSADDELGILYLPVEDATGDAYGGHRHGDNLFSATLVAMNIKTGKKLWHRQLVHHDIWDRDLPAAPILMDVTIDGRPRKIVVAITKQAFAYVYDRVTGEPIWPIEERPVPQSDVPGEKTARTQPFPTRPAPFDRQGVQKDDLIDFTPELRAEALEVMKKYRYAELFSPGSAVNAPDGTQGTMILPGVRGGANWEGAGVDPDTGMLYIGSTTEPLVYALKQDPKISNMTYVLEGGPNALNVKGLPIIKPPYGRITAIDMNTGDHVWMQANGDTPDAIKNNPALKGVTIPRTGTIGRSGVVVTKTLLIAGEGYGGAPLLWAYDKKTGEPVGKVEIPAKETGLPISYMYQGKQYVAMFVGGVGHPAELVAVRLPDAGAAPNRPSGESER